MAASASGSTTGYGNGVGTTGTVIHTPSRRGSRQGHGNHQSCTLMISMLSFSQGLPLTVDLPKARGTRGFLQACGLPHTPHPWLSHILSLAPWAPADCIRTSIQSCNVVRLSMSTRLSVQ